MQDDATGRASELEELFPAGIGKDRQAWIFLPEGVREGLLQITLNVHDGHVDVGHVEHKGDSYILYKGHHILCPPK